MSTRLTYPVGKVILEGAAREKDIKVKKALSILRGTERRGESQKRGRKKGNGRKKGKKVRQTDQEKDVLLKLRTWEQGETHGRGLIGKWRKEANLEDVTRQKESVGIESSKG